VSRATLSALLLALPLGGCAVSAASISPSDAALNKCNDASDCSGGICSDGMCQGRNGTLNSLLIAVTTPPTLVGINSFTYFADFTKDDGLGKSGGRLPIDLDAAVSVKGTVGIDFCRPSWTAPGLGTVETAADGSIPALVTFTPSQHAFGIGTDSYSAGPENDGFVFKPVLPAGQYDVYVKPKYALQPPWDTNPDCQVPPHLLLHQTIASTFDIKLQPASKLTVNITWPLAAPYAQGAEQTNLFLLDPLAGWSLDLIDQNSGQVLSNVQAVSAYLTPPTAAQTSVTYSVPLAYSPVYDSPTKGVIQPVNVGSEIIRLTPPAFDPRFQSSVPFTAPTILAQLDGALVDADGKPAPAQIVQDSPLPTPVTVQFQTALAFDGTPVPAGVVLTAENISGITGLSTSFSRTVQVGTDGTGSVDLLPGRYRVVAAPKGGCANGACLALAATEWVVAGEPPSQAGKLIEFAQAQLFSGTTRISGRTPVTGATVQALPSALYADSNVLNMGDATVAISPRATSGVVGSDGSFSFEADAGMFDLRVEPDPSTGYGWLVEPGISLPDQSQALDDLSVELPIFYRGTVTGVNQNGATVPIPKALIRAYVYMKRDGTVLPKAQDGAVAVQVAETYSDDENGDPGAFTLLIPKGISTP
jgi:hypothetical protein